MEVSVHSHLAQTERRQAPSGEFVTPAPRLQMPKRKTASRRSRCPGGRGDSGATPWWQRVPVTQRRSLSAHVTLALLWGRHRTRGLGRHSTCDEHSPVQCWAPSPHLHSGATRTNASKPRVSLRQGCPHSDSGSDPTSGKGWLAWQRHRRRPVNKAECSVGVTSRHPPRGLWGKDRCPGRTERSEKHVAQGHGASPWRNWT